MEGMVVIPTYNERENIAELVPRILAHNLHVLIVDDSSPDGTGRIADGLAAADRRVGVLHRPAKQGLGPAYLAGFRQALDRVALKAPIVIRLDGTNAEEGRKILEPHLSDRLRSAPTMLEAANQAVALAGGK